MNKTKKRTSRSLGSLDDILDQLEKITSSPGFSREYQNVTKPETTSNENYCEFLVNKYFEISGFLPCG
jgi:hypothetical protein